MARTGPIRWIVQNHALAACLDGLTDRVRRVLALFYGDGASRDDVGREVGMTPDGVKTTMRRAREKLRDCIERRLGDERR